MADTPDDPYARSKARKARRRDLASFLASRRTSQRSEQDASAAGVAGDAANGGGGTEEDGVLVVTGKRGVVRRHAPPVAKEDTYVTVVGSDESVEFVVPRDVLFVSETMRMMLSQAHGRAFAEGRSGRVVLPNVSAKTLEVVVPYCFRYYLASWAVFRPVGEGYEQERAEAEGQPDLAVQCTVKPEYAFDLLQAAHYLGMPPLVKLSARMVADNIMHVPDEALMSLVPDVRLEVLRLLSPLDLYRIQTRTPETTLDGTRLLWMEHLQRDFPNLELHDRWLRTALGREDSTSAWDVPVLVAGGEARDGLPSAPSAAAPAAPSAAPSPDELGGLDDSDSDEEDLSPAPTSTSPNPDTQTRLERLADETELAYNMPLHDVYLHAMVQAKASTVSSDDHRSVRDILAEFGRERIRYHWVQPIRSLEGFARAPSSLTDDSYGISFAEYLAMIPRVQHLSVSGNALMDPETGNLTALLDFVRSNPQLETLSMCDVGLCDGGVAELITALKESPRSVRRLVLSGNRIRRGGLVKLLAAAQEMQLEELNVSGNAIRGFALAVDDAVQIEQCTSLRKLVLSQNNLGDRRHFNRWRRTGSSVVRSRSMWSDGRPEWDASPAEIEDKAATGDDPTGVLVSLLQHLPRGLVHLDLASNFLRCNKKLMVALALKLPQLRYLSLAHNKISGMNSQNINLLFEAFKGHEHLRELDISDTDAMLGDVLASLQDLLIATPALRVLYLANNANNSGAVLLLTRMLAEAQHNLERVVLDMPINYSQEVRDAVSQCPTEMMMRRVYRSG